MGAGAGSPRASIEVVQHVDGRWMWGLSFLTGVQGNDGGAGYAPLPKWGRFAPSEDAAVLAAVEELRGRLDTFREGSGTQIIREWLQTVARDVQQPRLFEGSL
jgi:hypothetical protein